MAGWMDVRGRGHSRETCRHSSMAGAEGPGRPVREEARDPDRARSLMFLWATLGSPDFFLKAYSAMAAAKPMKAQAPLFTCVCVCVQKERVLK